MNLDAFVSETLKSLIQAITDTQEFAKQNNARINPVRYISGTKVMEKMIYYGDDTSVARPLSEIEFDVAVTVANQQESDIGGKISVLSIGAFGGGNKQADTNQIVSRIKFNLNVVLPHSTD
jgi:hypothetical protein